MVDTLSNLVCLFVIKNIFNVESLVGLPDLIGERLFELLLQNYFTETLTREKLIHGLYIFCAAYGHLVLTSVNLSNLLIMINEYTECFIPLLTNITSLNLSHCHFGVDHEIINHISHLRSLKVLCLSDCDVTDNVLQKLTIPCRLYKNGFSNLQELDLSCNPKLTSKSLCNLKCLNKLRIIVLSGTAITEREAKSFGEHIHLQLKKSSCFTLNEISTVGWAAALIMYWRDTSKKQALDKSYNTNKKNKPVRFYSRCRARLNMIKELKSSPPPKKHPSICLLKSSENPSQDLDTGTLTYNPNKTIGVNFPDEFMESYFGTFTSTSHNYIKRNLLDVLDTV